VPGGREWHATNIVTGLPSFPSSSTYIDAPNVPQTYLALQHDFCSPPKSRLWIYNWDERKAETILYEADFSTAIYGANLYDDDRNFISLDAAVAALPKAGGVLIVRRGVYDPVGQVVNYGPDSALLRAVAIAGTGIATVGSLSSQNPNIPENIGGAVTLSSNPW
jgi:hypothetical protein